MKSIAIASDCNQPMTRISALLQHIKACPLGWADAAAWLKQLFALADAITTADPHDKVARERAFRVRRDVHLQFAACIFDKPATAITPAEHLAAKRAAYFLAYGGGVETVARELNVPTARIHAAEIPPVDFAVFAGIGDGGEGHALWYEGDNIAVFVQEESARASDMKIGRVPPGISIWEGVFMFGGHEGEAVPQPRGVFRTPSELEWNAIRTNRSPWETPS